MGIRPLGELRGADAAVYGTKAANLGELLAAGFPVPDGVVLTSAPAPGELVRVLDRLDGPLAVRSSAAAEDLAGASFAGQYETLLDVRGAEALSEAVAACFASAGAERVRTYAGNRGIEDAGSMAVLVQRMVPAESAGVAFTADPVSGARDAVWVSAALGLGERLVSGEAAADEWVVAGGRAERRSDAERALTAAQAVQVAELARRVEAHFGCPQDIEWAWHDGTLHLLQARPITTLSDTRFELPEGAWSRNFRLGEWLPEAVSPLARTWLVPGTDEAFSLQYHDWFGFPAEPVPHRFVHGWYYTSMDFLPRGAAMLGLLFRHLLPGLLLRPRRFAAALPPLALLSIDLYETEWRERILPAHLALAEQAATEVDEHPPAGLPALLDRLIDSAGRYFASLTIVGGYAWKTELALARFWNKELPAVEGGHYALLAGLAQPVQAAHTVQSLDWAHPTFGELGLTAAHKPMDETRREAVARAEAALSGRKLARFRKLLAAATRQAPIREEHVAAFTVAWPTMRRALRRIGAECVARGQLREPDDVYLLERPELERALGGEPADYASIAERRAAEWRRQRRLAAPLLIGKLSGPMAYMFEDVEHQFGSGSEGDVHGLGASPGRVTGVARVLRGPEDFDRLAPGEIVVARATVPAWTPLFARAAAVVTDTGSVVAHASLVAREYGIPAIVGTGDATHRIPDGSTILVDGGTGTVTLLGHPTPGTRAAPLDPALLEQVSSTR